MNNYFALCPMGLGEPLAAELARLGGKIVATTAAGVAFEGDRATAYRANLHSRLASRILWRVAQFDYRDEHDIYDAALLLPWTAWFSVERTIKVEITARRAPVKSLDFVVLRVKDAVCDKFREVMGKRPSVAVREPDVRIHVHLEPAQAALYLDLSGEPLFKRGRREQVGIAPLKRHLAAGLIALTGWQPDEAFLDPMCGSGSLLMEAAEMALGIAPAMSGGSIRAFALEKLSDFDAALWSRLIAEARAMEKPKSGLSIFGADLYGDALKCARENLSANGLLDCVYLKQVNVLEVAAPASAGVWLTNPPYGDRMGERSELAALYPKIGDVLKQRFAGWRAYFFSADTALPKGIRLAASRRTPLMNGKIECRLYEYRMVAGGNRRTATPADDTQADSGDPSSG